MKNLLASLKLNAENLLTSVELLNLRGGKCDVRLCIDCVNTASGGGNPNNGGACQTSCNCYENCACWSECVQNVSRSCFANYSVSAVGCYCNPTPPVA